MKIHLHDHVLVTAGKDKGKKGEVTKVYPRSHRVLVKGVNTYKRHLKRQSDQNQGGIVQLERPLPVSNVAVICPTCKKPCRIGFDVSSQKTRICKKCRAPLKGK